MNISDREKAHPVLTVKNGKPIQIDTELSPVSENPVQNKAITLKVLDILEQLGADAEWLQRLQDRLDDFDGDSGSSEAFTIEEVIREIKQRLDDNDKRLNEFGVDIGSSEPLTIENVVDLILEHIEDMDTVEVGSEVLTVQEAFDKVFEDLDTEVQDRERADEELEEKINTLDGEVIKEVQVAGETVEKVGNTVNITNVEKTFATAGETAQEWTGTIQAHLNTLYNGLRNEAEERIEADRLEAVARQQEDDILQGEIDELERNLELESSERESEDERLEGLLDTERSERENEDERLAGLIEDEAEERQAEDERLAALIDSITSFEYEVIPADEPLPPIGEKGVIYLKLIEDGEEPNYAEEYVWIEGDSETGGRYELIGDTRIYHEELTVQDVDDVWDSVPDEI